MGIIRNRSLMSRTKSNDSRVYVPAEARDNQYIIAELKVNNLLVEQFSDVTLKPTAQELLNHLVNKLRRLALSHEVEYAALIASNRFIRVRFGVDNEVITTDEQHVFYYNPEKSAGLIGLCPKDTDSITSLRLVCFATGINIRENAAKFHQNIAKFIEQVKSEFSFVESVKLQDHQHISFNTEPHSAQTKSKAHGFRVIENRYLSSGVTIPKERNSKAFIVVKANFCSLLNETVLNQDIDVVDMHSDISKTLMRLAKSNDISQLAYVASTKHPVVKSNFAMGTANQNQEVLSLNFGDTQQEMIEVIDKDYSNSEAYLVFYIHPCQIVKLGYASYVNKVIKLLDSLGNKLHLAEQDKKMLLRFYQHVSYLA